MTRLEYFEKVGRLEQAAPQHPLLRSLRAGHTPMNELYLKNALGSVNASVIAVVSGAKLTKNATIDQNLDNDDDELEPDNPNDETLRSMRGDLAKLFAERRKLSDQFHALPTVEARAANSEEIQIVQRNIARTMKKIRTWKLTGIIPEDDQYRFYVPKDGLALANLRNSLRVRISRKSKEIEDLRPRAENDDRTARKLESALDYVKRLREELGEVDAAIKNLENG